ncbi:MAG: hypothetical protein C4320_06515, partial [Armatimonadota bacterium]
VSRFEYSSVARVVYTPNPNRPAERKELFVAGIANIAPGRGDAGEVAPSANQFPTDGINAATGSGGIVVFDRGLPSGAVVYRGFQSPGSPANTILGLPDPNVLRPLDQISIPASNNFAAFQFSRRLFAGEQLFRGVTSVTASATKVDGAPAVSLMVTDASGVYELFPAAAPLQDDPNRTVLLTRWMLPNDVYRGIYRNSIGNNAFALSSSSPFNVRPVYARRLNDETVIVVNGYQGTTRGGPNGAGRITGQNPFFGEVLQLDGRILTGNEVGAYNLSQPNLGFTLRSIQVRFGPLEGARGIVHPLFADRR